MKIHSDKRTKYEPCSYCSGYGVVSDYGNGYDFYGPKECKDCHGYGYVRARDDRGRFI